MPDFNAITALVIAVSGLLGGWFSQKAATRRSKVEDSINLNLVSDEKAKNTIDRQENYIAKQEKLIDEYMAEAKMWQRLYSNMRTYIWKVVDDLRRHDPEAAAKHDEAIAVMHEDQGTG